MVSLLVFPDGRLASSGGRAKCRRTTCCSCSRLAFSSLLAPLASAGPTAILTQPRRDAIVGRYRERPTGLQFTAARAERSRLGCLWQLVAVLRISAVGANATAKQAAGLVRLPFMVAIQCSAHDRWFETRHHIFDCSIVQGVLDAAAVVGDSLTRYLTAITVRSARVDAVGRSRTPCRCNSACNSWIATSPGVQCPAAASAAAAPAACQLIQHCGNLAREGMAARGNPEAVNCRYSSIAGEWCKPRGDGRRGDKRDTGAGRSSRS